MKKSSRTTKSSVRKGTIRKAIEGESLVAVFDLPALFYASEPKEPYLDPATVKFLAKARLHVKSGNTAWLKKNGAKLYNNQPLAS